MDPVELYMMGSAEDDDDMGRGFFGRRFSSKRRSRGGRSKGRRKPTVARSLRKKLIRGAGAAGATSPGLGNYSFAIPLATFTMAAAGPFLRTSNPQKPLKPMRLIIIVTRTPSTTGGLISFQPFIGTTLPLGTTAFLPAEAYGPETSNGRDNIAWPEVAQGTQVDFNYATSVAPAAMEQVDVSAVIMGPTAQ